MSKQARQELLEALKPEYREANRKQKALLLDGLIRATGYNRKHATKLLGMEATCEVGKRHRFREYGEDVREALITVWWASNRISSKRLVPFLPQILEKLEKFNHLQVTAETRRKLLSLSPSTVDRLLKRERVRSGRRRGTTRPGSLLKKHIPVCNFTEWNNTQPGFLEADLVAHCGDSSRGPFLSTLTMTDIATGWTELVSLPSKSESHVEWGINQVLERLPFPVQGLDTDNGGEFINNRMLKWCRDHSVTFTRSREYRKNDQAHVEEKNGSVVRRLIGYDRFEERSSCRIMNSLYAVARLYVNYFQPSMKLVTKHRDGARVSRKHDTAQTPLQRILASPMAPEVKERLQAEFDRLDPMALLRSIQILQFKLWKTATPVDLTTIARNSVARIFAESVDCDTGELVAKLRKQKQPAQRARRKGQSQTKAPAADWSETQKQVSRHILSLQDDEMFQTRDLFHLGDRAAIIASISRLSRLRKITRVEKGFYKVTKRTSPALLVSDDFNAAYERVRQYFDKLGPGCVVQNRDLFAFGSRYAVNQSLCRLQKRGLIQRIGRGRYTVPEETQFCAGGR